MSGWKKGVGRRLSAMVPALALGLAAGVTGGVLAAGALDTTPYGELQFNTASKKAHDAGKAEGLHEAQEISAQTASKVQAAHDARVAELEDRIDKANRDLSEQQRTLKQVREKADAQEAKLRSHLAETAAALNNATSSVDGQAVKGTLKTTWVLGNKDKPWPAGCAEPLKSYRVRVTAGQGATVAVADLVGSEVVRHTEKKTSVTLVCSMTYSADVPTPLGSEYRFVAESAESGHVRAQQTVSRDALSDGSGPALAVTQ
jgi:hypothetical protein